MSYILIVLVVSAAAVYFAHELVEVRNVVEKFFANFL